MTPDVNCVHVLCSICPCSSLSIMPAVVLVLGIKVSLFEIDGTPFIAMAELVKFVEAVADLSGATVKRAYYAVHPRSIRATSAQVKHLIATGVLSAGSRKAMLVSVATATRTLDKMGLSGAVAAFANPQPVAPAPPSALQLPSKPHISKQHQTHTVQAAMEAQEQASQAARAAAAVLASMVPDASSPGPKDPALQGVYPLEILPMDLSGQPSLKTCHLGLKTQAKSNGEAAQQWRALSASLQAFSTFSKALLNGARTEHNYLQDASMERMLGCISMFLGFLFKVEEVAEPGLGHYLNAPLMAKFLSFEMAREVQPKELGTHVTTAKRVVEFLRATGQLTSSRDYTLFPGHKEWLTTLSRQFAHMPVVHKAATTHPDDIATSAAANLSSLELLRRVRQVGEAAEALVPAAQASFDAAVKYVQLLMVYMLGGGMPGLRTTVMFSLCRPDYDGPCMHTHCANKNKCRGNRLDIIRHPQGGGIDGVGMQVTIVHHKTERFASGKQPLQFQVPLKLQQHLMLLLQPGGIRETMCRNFGNENPPYVFLTSTGGPYYSQLFYKVFRKHVGVPPGSSGGPQLTRTAVVDVMRTPASHNVPAPAPSEAGVATLLQNTTAVWNTHYDREMKKRQAEEALSKYPAWISQVLASQEQQQLMPGPSQADYHKRPKVLPSSPSPAAAVAAATAAPSAATAATAATTTTAAAARAATQAQQAPHYGMASPMAAAAACKVEEGEAGKHDDVIIVERPLEVIDLCETGTEEEEEQEEQEQEEEEGAYPDQLDDEWTEGEFIDTDGMSEDTSSSDSGESIEASSECNEVGDGGGWVEGNNPHWWISH
jgi:hypothetical protein